jgi:TatA/E family protein of Tat protein translocase
MPGPLELVIILVIALLILGPGRLPDVGSALGKGLREFRKASSDIQDSVNVDTSPLPPDAPPAAPVATPTTAVVAAPVAEPAAAPGVPTAQAAVAAPVLAASVAPTAPAAPAGPESFALPPDPTAPLMAAAASGPAPVPTSAEQPGSGDAS